LYQCFQCSLAVVVLKLRLQLIAQS
jgi:hypothetical protein